MHEKRHKCPVKNCPYGRCTHRAVHEYSVRCELDQCLNRHSDVLCVEVPAGEICPCCIGEGWERGIACVLCNGVGIVSEETAYLHARGAEDYEAYPGATDDLCQICGSELGAACTCDQGVNAAGG